MTGLERLRELSGELHSALLSEIADQIEREHAQTVEDHEKQRGIIRDLQRERDEALRDLKKCRDELRSAYSATIAASSDYADLQGEIFTMCEAFGVELEKGDRGDVAEQKLIAKVYEIIREKDEALRAAATCRRVASELRTLAGEWDEWGLGGTLMALADRLEAHEAAAAHSTEVASKTYTRDELGERKASCDDHHSEPDATFEGEKVTLDASIAIPVLAVVEEMERHCLGVEWMQDSPVARWARKLREVVGWPVRGEEDARAAKWVREHGGLESVKEEWRIRVPRDKHEMARKRLLDHIAECETALGRRNKHIEELGRRVGDITNENAELRKRLMPPGMEWPRFEDGEKVCIANKFASQEDGEAHFVRAILVDNAGVDLISDECSEHFGFGERVKRPKPAPVGSDGLPIKRGETVRGTGRSQHEFEVLDTHNINPEVGSRFSVKCFDKNDGEVCWCDPKLLTHAKPEPPDSWEQLEKDARLDPCEYYSKKLHGDCADCPARCLDSCVSQHGADLVRRAKALAERERGE